MEDLKKIHYSLSNEHADQEPIVQLSLDGVMESKSSLTSLDTYSIKFNHCRNIYPVKIIRPCDRYKYDEELELNNLLNDIKENHIIIDCAVADNPKRSFLRCAKCFAAKYACEYCENAAVSFVKAHKKSIQLLKKRYELKDQNILQQIQTLQEAQDSQTETDNDTEEIITLRALRVTLEKEKELEIRKTTRKHLTWPASTMCGNLRTMDNITAIVNEIEINPEILKSDPDFCKGIKGKSLMLHHPFFNMLKDLPCEYMHLVCLGVVKRMVSLTFKVGESRERTTKRPLSDPKLYNDQIALIQVTREFSKRGRNLDFGVMKALEFRNLLIFYFPIVLDCIDDVYKNEKRMWLHLVYMIRACVLPNNEFVAVDNDLVESACKKFYILYEKTYGTQNCTYSIHVTGSHLLKVRGNRPLTFKSAFKFENFFAEMKHLFHPGTVSPLKQILANCFMKRLLEYHCCEKSTYYSPEKKPVPGKKFNPGKETNHLVYVHSENNKTTIYSIVEIIDDQTFRCNTQGKFAVKMQLTPEYDWSKVGVFRVGPISEEDHYILKKDIAGKVLKVKNYLITCPLNVLHEQ